MSTLIEAAKKAPIPSGILGIGALFLITRLPLFAIVGFLVRTALALVKPALFLLGAIKILTLLQWRVQRAGKDPQAAQEIQTELVS